jgi:hypothetical protein
VGGLGIIGVLIALFLGGGGGEVGSAIFSGSPTDGDADGNTDPT